MTWVKTCRATIPARSQTNQQAGENTQTHVAVPSLLCGRLTIEFWNRVFVFCLYISVIFTIELPFVADDYSKMCTCIYYFQLQPFCLLHSRNWNGIARFPLAKGDAAFHCINATTKRRLNSIKLTDFHWEETFQQFNRETGFICTTCNIYNSATIHLTLRKPRISLSSVNNFLLAQPNKTNFLLRDGLFFHKFPPFLLLCNITPSRQLVEFLTETWSEDLSLWYVDFVNI